LKAKSTSAEQNDKVREDLKTLFQVTTSPTGSWRFSIHLNYRTLGIRLVLPCMFLIFFFRSQNAFTVIILFLRENICTELI